MSVPERPRSQNRVQHAISYQVDFWRLPFSRPASTSVRRLRRIDGGFFEAWEDKKNDAVESKKALSQYQGQGPAVILPALTWLSLVGLHPCRAQLRFTR